MQTIESQVVVFPEVNSGQAIFIFILPYSTCFGNYDSPSGLGSHRLPVIAFKVGLR